MNNIKKLFAAAIICTVTFLGYNTYKTATMTEEEKFMQANIDALTENEGGNTADCYSSSTRDIDSAYTDCSSCTRIEGWKGTGSTRTCSN